MAEAFTAKNNGALYIQPQGANHDMYLLGCHDLGEVPAPEGGIDLLRCFNPLSGGWDVIGETSTPPDKVSFTVGTLMESEHDWLETVHCPFNMCILERDCGQPSPNNYVRGQAITHARRTNKRIAGAAKREEDEGTKLGFDVEAWENVDFDDLTVQRKTTATTDAVNGSAFNFDRRCIGDCGDPLEPGDEGVIVTDSAAGPAKATPQVTVDAGQTWTDTAADPFAAAASIVSVARFYVGRDTIRILAAMDAPAGAQGMVGYSDDNGATWTTVNVGGAAAGHGGVYGYALFALDQFHIWLASALGYIYFSDDGGETWTAQEAGVIHIGSYYGVHFSDEDNGFAWGAAGVRAKTTDGGTTWTATTVPVAATMFGGAIIDVNRLWVGGDGGALYFSEDAGVTWTQRTGWVGSGVGDVRGISFVLGSDLFGFIISDTAAPRGYVLRTYNGGRTWDRIANQPTNAGLNHVLAISPNLAYAVGNVSDGTGVILKASA